MYIGHTFITQKFQRGMSMLGRSIRVYAFLCDHCTSLFFRNSKTMDNRRLNNNYKHYCGHCGSYHKLAQRDSAKRKRILKHDASSTLPINRLF